MKIALITPGGVDRSGTHRVIPCLLWLIERLARRHEVHVFSLFQEPEPARYPLLGATVHNIGRGRTRPRTIAAIVREHRRGAFDVLHAFWAVPSGVIAAVAGRMLRRPVVLHLAGGELARLPDIGYGGRRTLRGRAWTRLALRGAARVTAPSGPMCAAAARLGVRAERVPLGVDLERWPVTPPRPRDLARPARLLHVASLNRVKDQHALLHAAAMLARDGVGFTLQVVGQDTLHGAARRKAAELDLADRVAFHGFVPQDRLRSMVLRSDALLVSSRHEAGPIVALEAAVCGVPTIGTAVGHIAEWAPDAAVAVPVGDPAALADATAALLADEERRLRIAAAAQARAAAEDADRTAQRFAEIYREVSG